MKTPQRYLAEEIGYFPEGNRRMASGAMCIARPYRPNRVALWERFSLAAMVFFGKLDTVCFMEDEDASDGIQRLAKQRAIDDRNKRFRAQKQKHDQT